MSCHSAISRHSCQIMVVVCAVLLLFVASSAYSQDTKTAEVVTKTTNVAKTTPLSYEQVKQLLLKARTAMKAGKFKEAEQILVLAESAKLRYPVLHFGDTPTRLRRDLQKAGKLQGAKITVSPTEQATTEATKNPFLKALRKTNVAKADSKQKIQQQETTPNNVSLQSLSEIASVPGETQHRNDAKAVHLRASGQLADYQAALSQPTSLSKRQGVRPASGSEEVAPVAVDLTLPSLNEANASPLQFAQTPERESSPDQGLLPQPDSPFELLQKGEKALRSGDRAQALQLFREAYVERNLLDPHSREQLQDHLQMLSGRTRTGSGGNAKDSLLNAATSEQTVLARQLSAEIGKRQSEASQLRKSDPHKSLEILRDTQQQIEDSTLGQGMKTQLHRRVELGIIETEKYIKDHQAELELDAANKSVLEEIDRERQVKLQVQQRLADLVEEYNVLRNEQRYAEMEIVAQRAVDMAPNDLLAQQLKQNAKFLRRTMLNREIEELTEGGVVDVLTDARKTAGDALVDSTKPMTFPKKWNDLVQNRRESGSRSSRQTEHELDIQRKLRTQVLPRYTDMPLSEVIDSLAELSGINIYLDPRGLSQEGIRSDIHVSLSLPQEISLESALTLILERLHLTYVIKNEVLKVTSEQIRDGELITVSYNVADLVVPIPNFVPSSSMGLPGLLEEAYQALPLGVGAHSNHGPAVVMAGNQPPQPGGPIGPNIMPQQFGGGAAGGNATPPIGMMPGSPGGAAQADFDSLIDLIVGTIDRDSWMENGTGEGEIQPFPTNLSLVISQTQTVHEQIADLLEQLRRLQDLQVTIEVRFIRLTDRFFERIGIDFDFNIEDGIPLGGPNDPNVSGGHEGGASSTFGLSASPVGLSDPFGTVTVDLDVPFRNSSFGLSTPQFGTPQPVGQFGFAILSDIEAFFLIEASQGDSRTNVLQAPKVTLFNGQQATVIDAAQVPFVISVVPVVGEFAAAQQPVIVVLSEGTMLTVQAVVSDDRRYVRLTLVPFFSQIGDVSTFTFEGSETTTSSSNTTDQDDDGNNEANDNANTVVRSGTTVQLPTFEVISVSTTVSVPDGGTVLLGGIKRLKEGRSEAGVPLLSKMPYIDRLFRNVGIGRETDSLMMMVTPHIIIQEEEEERRGIAVE